MRDFIDEHFGFFLFVFGTASVVGLCLLAVVTSRHEREACEALGGRIKSYTASGVGVGVTGNGNIAVVPTTTTINFCLAPDGRILR